MKTNEATIITTDNDDNLERINDEIQFVTSAYTPDEAWVETTTPPPPVPTSSPSSHHHHHPPLIIHRRLTLKIKNDVTLSLTIPKGYPSHKSLLVDGTTTITTTNKDAMMTILPQLLCICREEAEEQIGNEAVFAVLTRADSWIDEWRESSEMTTISDDDDDYDDGDTTGDTNNAKTQQQRRRQRLVTLWGRRSIYSHHIIAQSKRRSLSSLASQYELGGYVKIGWPGLIVVEGLEENVASFVEEIRSWRWQYLTVRGEQRVEVVTDGDEEVRVFEKGFRELGEDGGMKELGRICREVGLEQLFLTAINRGDGNDGGGGGGTSTSSSSNDNDNQKDVNGNSTQKIYGAMIQLDHMNDTKTYTKWLQKTSQATGCHVLIRQCCCRRRPNNNNSNTKQQSKQRPFLIIVFLYGDQRSNVKQFLKRWRTSKVDVDARGTPCLERMMTLLMEGEVVAAARSSLRRRRQQQQQQQQQQVDDDDEMVMTVTKEELKDMACRWGGRGWEDVIEEVLDASSRSDKGNEEM